MSKKSFYENLYDCFKNLDLTDEMIVEIFHQYGLIIPLMKDEGTIEKIANDLYFYYKNQIPESFGVNDFHYSNEISNSPLLRLNIINHIESNKHSESNKEELPLVFNLLENKFNKELQIEILYSGANIKLTKTQLKELIHFALKKNIIHKDELDF